MLRPPQFSNSAFLANEINFGILEHFEYDSGIRLPTWKLSQLGGMAQQLNTSGSDAKLKPKTSSRVSSALKSGVVYGGSAVLTAVNNITPHIAGAVDILVIEQPDGSRKATPFYVRFGKYTALRTGERDVKLYVNDELAPFGMHIGMYGQAYFATDTEMPAADEDEEQDAILAGMMSPPSGYSSGADDTAAGPVDDAGAALGAVQRHMDGIKEARKESGLRRWNAAPLGASETRSMHGAHAPQPELSSSSESLSTEGVEGVGGGPSTGGAALTAVGRGTAGGELVGPSLTTADRNESFLSARETLPTPLSDDIVGAVLAAGLSSLGPGRPPIQEAPPTAHEPTSQTAEGWGTSSRMGAPPLPLVPVSEGTSPSGWSDGEGEGEGEGEGGQSGRTGSSPVSYASPPDRARLVAMGCSSETWGPVEVPAASPMLGRHTQVPTALQLQQTQQHQEQQTQQQQHTAALVGISPHGVQQPLHQQLGFPENPSPVFQAVSESGAPPTVPALAPATADGGKLPPLLPATGGLPAVDWQQLLAAGTTPASEAPAAAEPAVLSHALSVTISTSPPRDAANAAAAGAVVNAWTLRPVVAQSLFLDAPRSVDKASPAAEGLPTWTAQVEGGAPASHGSSAPHPAVSLLSSRLRIFGGGRGGSVGSAAATTLEAGPSGSAPCSSRPWPQATGINADSLWLSAHNAAMAAAGSALGAGPASPHSVQLTTAEYSSSFSSAFSALPGGATGALAGGAMGAVSCLGPIAAAAAASAVSYCCTSSSRAVAVTLSPTPEGGVRLQLSAPPPLLSSLVAAAAIPVDVSTAVGGPLHADAAHVLLGASPASVVSVASGPISPCDTEPSAVDTTTTRHPHTHLPEHSRSISHTDTLPRHHPHAITEHLHSTSAPPTSSGAITVALEAAAAVAVAPAAAAAASCALELSLCGGLLTRTMSHSEATALFEAYRLSEEVFAIRGPALLASPDLVVRLGNGAMYPWQALSYSLAGLLAFGTWRLPEDVVCWAPEGSAVGGLGPVLGPGTTAAAAAVTALLSAVAQGTGATVSTLAGGKDSSDGGGSDGAVSADAIRCTTSATSTPKKDVASAAVAGSAGAGTAAGASGGSSWRLWMFGARRESTGRTSATGGSGTATSKSPPRVSSPVTERQGTSASGGKLSGAVSVATSPPPAVTTVAATAAPPQQSSGSVVTAAADGAASEGAPAGGGAGSASGGGAAAAAVVGAVGVAGGNNKSGGGRGRSRRQGYNVVTKKNLSPDAEQLAALPLKHGQNTIVYKIGGSELKAYVYYLPWRTKIVISDIDGTITRSDVLGHLLPAMGLDWSHPGIAQLLTNIRQNNYLIMYLSSRSISQANITRDFINTLVQGEHRMPLGPVIISPHGLLPSLYREMILRRPHEFKIATLQDIRALFPPSWNPFYGGFGNRDTDEISYREVGVLPNRIFIINPRGELRQPKDHTATCTTASESQQLPPDRETGSTESATESGTVESPTAAAAGGVAAAPGSPGSATGLGGDALAGEGPGPSAASVTGPTAPATSRSASGTSASRGRGASSAATTSTGGPTALSSLSAINDLVHHIFPPVRYRVESEEEEAASDVVERAAVEEEKEEGSAQAVCGRDVEGSSNKDRRDSRDGDGDFKESEGWGVDCRIGRLAKALAGSSLALGYTTAVQSAEDLVAWGEAATALGANMACEAAGDIAAVTPCVGACEVSASASTCTAATPLAACSQRRGTATPTASDSHSPALDAEEVDAGALLQVGVSGGGCSGGGCGAGGCRGAASSPVAASYSVLPISPSACLTSNWCIAEGEGGATQGVGELQPTIRTEVACKGDSDAAAEEEEEDRGGLSVRAVTVRVPVCDGGAGDEADQPLMGAAATSITSPKARLSGAEPSVVKGVAATA